MKRQSERVLEGEITEDLWTGVIFPFLYNDQYNLWMTRQEVSKDWFRMIRDGIVELRLATIPYKNEVMEKYKILGERFQGNIIKLEAHAQGILSFRSLKVWKSLKELTLSGGIIRSLTVDMLTSLTSLTMGPCAYVCDMEKLVNLTHLSMMHLDNITHPETSVSCRAMSGLKRLGLGKSVDYDTTVVNLKDYIPPEAQLEYLESTSRVPFLDYVGHGKYWFGNNTYYEGGWLKGRLHGEGIYVRTTRRVEGNWEMGELKRGKIIYSSGAVYEGELRLRRPHGFGKLTNGSGQIWEGMFREGRVV